jgi:hypothetical protein
LNELTGQEPIVAKKDMLTGTYSTSDHCEQPRILTTQIRSVKDARQVHHPAAESAVLIHVVVESQRLCASARCFSCVEVLPSESFCTNQTMNVVINWLDCPQVLHTLHYPSTPSHAPLLCCRCPSRCCLHTQPWSRPQLRPKIIMQLTPSRPCLSQWSSPSYSCCLSGTVLLALPWSVSPGRLQQLLPLLMWCCQGEPLLLQPGGCAAGCSSMAGEL